MATATFGLLRGCRAIHKERAGGWAMLSAVRRGLTVSNTRTLQAVRRTALRGLGQFSKVVGCAAKYP